MNSEIEPISFTDSNIEDIYALSPVQEGMLLNTLREPGAGLFFQQMVIHLKNPDVAAFLGAWQRLLDRHPILRTSFHWEGLNKPVQVVHRRVALPVEHLDWRSLASPEGEQRLKAFLHTDRQRGWVLTKPPLLRLTLIQLNAFEYYCVRSNHHLLLDRWSGSLVFKEIPVLYRGLRQGRELDLPLPRPYRDYIAWLQRQDPTKAEAFWREYLAGFTTPTPLPGEKMVEVDIPLTERSLIQSLSLSAILTLELESVAQRLRITLSTLLQGAWALLLSLSSDQEDVVFGVVVSGRPADLKDVEKMIGLFLNALPLRIRIDPELPLETWLREVHAQQARMQPYQHTPLVQVQGWSEVPRGMPLFETLVTFINESLIKDGPSEGSAVTENDLSVKQRKNAIQRLAIGSPTSDPLLLTVVQTEELVLRLTADARRFEVGTLIRLLEQLRLLLHGFAAAPTRKMGDLSLLAPGEQQRVVHDWNHTQTYYSQNHFLQQLFELQVERIPNAIAITFERAQLSYGELNCRANQLAHRLRQQGVGPGVLVGLYVEPSLEMVVGSLGVLKAGGAYVPLGPTYPRDRLASLLEDVQPFLLLTQRRLVSGLPQHRAQVVCLDTDWWLIAQASDGNPTIAGTPEDLACVIYTSGSKGEAKGVQIPHRALVNFLESMRRQPGLTDQDVLLAVTTLSSDMAVMELYLPLCVGARLVVASGEVAADGAQLLEKLCSSGATIMQALPATWRLLVAAGWPGSNRLKILCGGEALPRDLADQLLARGASVWNLYGSTETTIWSAVCQVEPGKGRVPIGRPIANTRMYVLDKRMRPVPIGVAGEMFIAGVGLARGYLGPPGITAGCFLPDPFANEEGGRMCRTGDIARWLPDGQMEILGWVDHQIKVCGCRIDPGEIEAVLCRLPNVHQVAVVAASRQELTAYVVFASGQAPLATKLRNFARQHLPVHMVPARFTALEKLPLTPSGRVDRRALSALKTNHHEPTRQDLPPKLSTKAGITDLWAEVRRVATVGAEDNFFFELSDHSLQATRIVSRLGALLGTEISQSVFIESPAILEMREHVQQGSTAAPTQSSTDREWPNAVGVGRSAQQRLELTPVPHDRAIPLSFSQRRIWSLDQLEPGNGFFNVFSVTSLTGELRLDALNATFTELVRRHEALRTTFDRCDGEPLQVINPSSPCQLEVVDLRGLPEKERQPSAWRLSVAEVRKPFNLSKGPLLRAGLLRLHDDEHLLLVTIHHIAADGWSMVIFQREFGILYRLFSEGRPTPLPELPLQYADFAVWQRSWLQGMVLERQLNYWKTHLAGVARLELPTDRPWSAAQTYQGAIQSISLPASPSDQLAALSQREGTTPFMTFLATFQVLLGRYTGQTDIAVVSPIGGRTPTETEGIMGCFLNMLVFRTDLSGAPTFRELLGRVKKIALGANAHQDVPFEMVLEAVPTERSLGYSPLSQVLFSMVKLEGMPLHPPKFRLEPLRVPGVAARFDLTLYVREQAEGLDLTAVYNAHLFEAATIKQMLEHFRTLLDGVAVDPDRCLSALPMLTTVARSRRARGGAGILSAAHRDIPGVEFREFRIEDVAQSIPERFAEQVRRYPHRIAVKAEPHEWTYAQLNHEANRIARTVLAVCGVGDRVALLFGHGAPMIAGILGALKAGSTYVALDPQQPLVRLDRIVEDAQVRVVVTCQENYALGCALVREPLVLIDIDAIEPTVAGDDLSLAIPPDGLAYLLYTSGSTGQPKGVMQSHRNMLQHIRHYTNGLRITAEDRLTLFAPYGFDAAVMDIYGALMNGAALYPINLRLEDATAVCRRLGEHGITLYHSTPTVFRHILGAAGTGLVTPSVRLVVLGGEETLRTDFELYRMHFAPGCMLVNGLGPTESTLALQYFLDHETELSRATVPVGYPVEGTEVLLLDETGEPGTLYGEIALRSSHLALGYWRRPDLTAAAFLPDPAGAGGRIYRTGDVGRLLPDGAIEFRGRKDRQIKLRGFRIELDEVEAALAEHPAVREAAIVTWEDVPDALSLVAYIVPAQDPAPSADKLRTFLREKLPDYMVPSTFLTLSSLPLTANGKVDRRALPTPEPTRPDDGSYVGPSNEVEELVAGVWADLLRRDRVGIHDNFFDLGGHSLLAMQVLSRLRSLVGVEVPIPVLFNTPTVAGLAAWIEANRHRLTPDTALPLVAATPCIDGWREAPQSFAQQRLWFLAQMAPGSPLYNTMAVLPFRGVLDIAALERTIAELAGRHESLRTTFGARDGEPIQIVAPPMPVLLAVVDLRGLPGGHRRSELQHLRQMEIAQPFNLARGPLGRFKLVRLEGQRQVLLVSMHHIITDGWSMGVLRRELRILYETFRAGQPSPLPDLPLQYADFAIWQRQWLQGDVLQQQLDYWKEKLLGASRLDLPTDWPRPLVPRYVSARQPFKIDSEVTEKLYDLSQQEDATLFMTLLAAFQVVLGQYSGQDDVVVGTPIANRTRSELEGVIGFFVNTLVMRTDLSGAPSFRQLLRRVQQTCLGAYAHQDLPFEKLVEELSPQRDLSTQPLFQVLFVLQNTSQTADEPARRSAEVAPANNPEVAGLIYFDLTLSLMETGAAVVGALHFNTDLFDPETAERLVKHLQTLLATVADQPDEPLSARSMISDPERRRLLVEWNGSIPVAPERCIHRLVEEQVDRAPDHIAVTFGGQALSSRELDSRANRLAHHLRGLGVRPEMTVGLYLERGPEAIVGLLGILKAGGVYLPLDPALPPDRLAWILSDAAPVVLLTQEAFRSGLPPSQQATVLCLDALQADLQREPDTRPVVEMSPGQLAYVIYTSGSTGRPKGVMVEHRSLCHTICAQVPLFGLTPDCRVLSMIALSFDASLGEIFRALVAGATLCLARREELLPGPDLIRLLREQHITTATMVPVALAALPTEEALPELSTITVGGEALPAELALRWGRGRRLLNGYGPTETTIGATLACAWDLARKPPLGRPLPNVRAYVLDGGMQLLPQGVPGELYLGGPGLARGYLNRPDLTVERFLPDPFRSEPGARLYRTGDRVRWLPDGQLEFRDRVDDQIKVRGFRVEPGEVAAVLRQHPRVREAVALARKDRSGESRLVAYLVPTPDTDESAGAADDLVAEWQRASEVAATEVQAVEVADPRLNFTGWTSSYTGQPIPPEEMRQWADSTVERITRLRHRDVLEIGSGTGLILFRLAAQCRHYLGVDFSAGLLEQARRKLPLLGNSTCQVELQQRRADELDDLADGSFDCVVLNSVVQYFPDIDYLLRVLHGAERLVRAGGTIFIGDVRNLRLLDAFHASVQLSRAAATLPASRLAQRARRHGSLERELVLDPGLFTRLLSSWPRLTHVQVLPKAGTTHNELSQFRYDVVLYIEGQPPIKPGCTWLTWHWDSPVTGLQALRETLLQGPAQLGMRGVPNARTVANARLQSWLDNRPELRTVAELRQELARVHLGVEPEALTMLGQELCYNVESSWLNCDAEGRYDVLFCRKGEDVTAEFPVEAPTSRPWQEYANSPAQAVQGRTLAAELRDYLGEQLPEYMIPSAFVLLEALPLTTHGKLDRKALPDPEGEDERTDLSGSYVAPRTVAEKVLAEIWTNLLRLERVGIHDNFFELGGDSILGIRIIARASQAGLHLTTQDVYRFQTVAEQAVAAGATEVVAAEQGLVTGDLPLTPIQQWFFEGANPEPQHFNWATFLPAPRGLSTDQLRQTLKTLLEHHDALRLRFVRTGSGTWQQLLAETNDEVPLTVVDLSDLPPQEQREAIEARAAELQTSLNLAQGPLLRLGWFDLGVGQSDSPSRSQAPALQFAEDQGQTGYLLLIVHHLTIDTISWPILLEDLRTLLRQLRGRKPLQLPAKTSSFKQWAEYLLEHARSGALNEEHGYWLNERRQVVARLPVDHPAGLNSLASRQEVTVIVDEEESRVLQNLAPSIHAAIDEVLLAALGMALARWTGSWRVLVNVERHGRDDLGSGLNLSRTVGWFANIAPVLLDLPPEVSPLEVLKAVQTQLQALPNRGIGYGLLRYLGDATVKGQLQQLPQAEVFFCYQGQQRRVSLGDKARGSMEWQPSVGPQRSQQGSRRHLIEINAMIQQGKLQMRWSFSSNLHERASVENLTREFVGVLQAILTSGRPRGRSTLQAEDFPEANLDHDEFSILLGQLSAVKQQKAGPPS